MTWTNTYGPDHSQTLRFSHILLLWKDYFVHLYSSDKTQALNPIKRCQGARGMNQRGQHEGGTAAETHISNCSRTTFSVSINKLIQISSSEIPRILTARKKEGGTSTPGKLAARRYLCRCHGSSCCACQGGISVNMSPQSSVAVGTHTRGGEPVVSDTGQRRKPNSWC